MLRQLGKGTAEKRRGEGFGDHRIQWLSNERASECPGVPRVSVSFSGSPLGPEKFPDDAASPGGDHALRTADVSGAPSVDWAQLFSWHPWEHPPHTALPLDP